MADPITNTLVWIDLEMTGLDPSSNQILEIATIVTDNNLEVRNKGIDYVKKMLHITRWLEAESFLLVPGAVDVFFRKDYEKVPYDVCYSRSKESIREIIPTAEDIDVNICIENVANKFLLSPLEMRDFIDSFSSNKVCSYLDVGNLLYTGGYPEDWIRILGKRIKYLLLSILSR